MATYTYTGNVVPSDPDQYFILNVTFENGAFTWNVTANRSDGATGNVVRNNIYGLTVNIGGNSYYKGDIAYGNYTVGSVVYNGVTQLTNCTITAGAVAVSVSGNFWYGTWNATYRSSASGNITITSPTVATPTYTIGNPYSSTTIVGGYSTLSWTFSATAGTAGNTISNYALFQDGVQVYSGATASCTITAPSGGSHTYYCVATESNGATGTSSTVSVTTVAYTQPTFTAVSSIRWSTGNSSGSASDDGTYARLSATFTQSAIGGTNLTTTLKATVSSYTNTTTTSGAVLYSGSILSPDSSYQVTYKLYDSYVGEANAVVRTDIITIGSRGIDLVHTAEDGYGLGFGMKGTAGYFDTALATRIVDIDSSGNITNKAEINATPTLESTSAITRTGGWTIQSQSVYKWGRVVVASMILNASSSVASGSNCFTGTLASAYKPKTWVSCSAYFSSAVMTALLDPNGNIIIRVGGSGSAGGAGDTEPFTFVYLI